MSDPTTLKVIKKFVKPGSIIWTDSFTSYNCLSDNGFIHESVNHRENYVDPVTGAHTQGVERAWLDSKAWYRASRGNRTLLQSHLDESAWRQLRSPERDAGSLFTAFLRDIGKCFRV